MRYEPPSDSELAALVQAAVLFRDAAPWRHIRPKQIFGIRSIDSGRLSYVSIEGHEGGVTGLGAYPGHTGLETLLGALHGLLEVVDDQDYLRMSALTCGYFPYGEFAGPLLEFLDRSGVRFTRHELAPAFTSYVPGFRAWRPDARESRLLTAAFEQTLVVVEDLRRDPGLLDAPDPITVLSRRAIPGLRGLEWEYEWSSLEPDWAARVKPWKPDELTAARLARLPLDDRQEWEFDAVVGLGVLAPDPGSRAEILRAGLLVDRASDFIHWLEPFPASELKASLGEAFAQQMLRIGCRPRRILVRDRAIRRLIEPITQAADCRLQKVQNLPALEEAHEVLLQKANRPARDSRLH